MKLTGKCKADFKKWYVSTQKYFYDIDYAPNNMKYGVYVDFFVSVGLNVLMFTQDAKNYYTNILKNGRYLIKVGGYNTRQEAREQAIEKANEIYNG